MAAAATARRISGLLSRSFTSSKSSAWLLQGKIPRSSSSAISRFSTAALEEPITPPVQVDHTQLLINGKFVDSASGDSFLSSSFSVQAIPSYRLIQTTNFICFVKLKDKHCIQKIEPLVLDVVQRYLGEVDYGYFMFQIRIPDCLHLVPGKTFPTLDPRTGEVIAHVAEGDAEDIDRAVSAARKAFDEGPWPKMTPYERSRIIYRFADLIEKHNDELAALETWDNGKPYEQAARVEVPILTRLMRYYAGWADKIHGLVVPADGPHHVEVLHEPIGVAGQIIPWNFPLLMLAWKVGPALACGNTIVLKTAEQTPLSALYAARLLHEAGLPPGVLNVVSGFGPTAGAALASHMDVDKLAFTGSTATGKTVLEMAAKSNLKAVTLELGGKSPFIICENADVDKAVEVAHFALFFNQGQCCCAGSRTFVHESVYDEFLEKAKARALRRVVGDPFKKGVEQGPQIDEEQFSKVMRYIRSGIESGATLETGGERIGNRGYYIQPTIFSEVKDGMDIARDEIFGPVQSIFKFRDLQEVIRRANATRYGLAAGVFTHDIDTANTLVRALRVGTVWVNCFDVFDAAIPFGGYKMSGQGREKGIDSLKNYLQIKAVVTPLKNPAWL